MNDEITNLERALDRMREENTRIQISAVERQQRTVFVLLLTNVTAGALFLGLGDSLLTLLAAVCFSAGAIINVLTIRTHNRSLAFLREALRLRGVGEHEAENP